MKRRRRQQQQQTFSVITISLIIIFLQIILKIEDLNTDTSQKTIFYYVDGFTPRLQQKRAGRYRHHDNNNNIFYGKRVDENRLSVLSDIYHHDIENDSFHDHHHQQEDDKKKYRINDNNNQKKFNLTLLLIDHYDSFTYNLYDILSQLTVNPPIVLAKDAYDSWIYNNNEQQETNEDEQQTKKNNIFPLELQNKLDGIILSPGPGTPEAQPKFSKHSIHSNPSLPILGVCLGHQLLALEYGGQVDKAPIPIHGRDSRVLSTSTSNTSSLFHGLPPSWNVIRYHSLAVIPNTLPSSLDVIAISGDDNVIQGIQHKTNPHYGVQFHPESIGTQYGYELLKNFCKICQSKKLEKNNNNNRLHLQSSSVNNDKKNYNKPRLYTPTIQMSTSETSIHFSNGMSKHLSSSSDEIKDGEPFHETNGSLISSSSSSSSSRFKIYIHKLLSRSKQVPRSSSSTTVVVEPELVFQEMYSNHPYAMWLDSCGRNHSQNELSILAAPSTEPNDPLSIIKEYHYNNNDNNNNNDDDDNNNNDILSWLNEQLGQPSTHIRMVTTLEDQNYNEKEINVSFENNKKKKKPYEVISELDISKDDIPFDFRGGYMGYLGYEVRHDTERFLREEEHGGEAIMASSTKTTTITTSKKHNSSSQNTNNGSSSSSSSSKSKELSEKPPTAAFFLAKQSMVYHHPTRQWYLIGVSLIDNDGQKGNDDDDDDQKVLKWMKETNERMKELEDKIKSTTNKRQQEQQMKQKQNPERDDNNNNNSNNKLLKFVPNRSQETYERNIAECHEQIRLGESYELCLTNQLEAIILDDEEENNNNNKFSSNTKPRTRKDPFGLYQILRRHNPAPFSAFLNWNINPTNLIHQEEDDYNKNNDEKKMMKQLSTSSLSSSSLAICCTSPERFMSVERQFDNSLQAEAKPIKGTCARVIPKNGIIFTDEEEREDRRRANALELSMKNRAENLMIVDLLRNDMSRVCKIGSVHVANLMAIESYATVHQMVSTIRGTLSDGRNKNDYNNNNNNNNNNSHNEEGREEDTTTVSKTSVDLLKACFPGGSMTGAPKLSSMELLEEMEEYVDRGPYSGSLGYISLNGCMDMNIIIRTAIVTPLRNDNDDDNKNSNRRPPSTSGGGYKVSVGAGGAITALSDSKEEYDEMLIKAGPIVRCVQEWAKNSTFSSSQQQQEEQEQQNKKEKHQTINNAK